MKTTRMLVILVLALGLAAEVANADFTFGTPTNLGPIVNTSRTDDVPSISADGLELYFRSNRAGGYGSQDIWVTTRATTDDPWGTPVNLGPKVNSSAGEWGPSISADGLSLYFSSQRPGGEGAPDLWVTTRATVSDPWSTPVNLGPPVNSSAGEWLGGTSISADGLSLYFGSDRLGGYGDIDLYVTTRATVSDPWGTPVNLGPKVNSSAGEWTPSIFADGLRLFFGSLRPGGYGGRWGDIWVTTRQTKADPWGEPVNLGPTVNSAYTEMTASISADGSTLYFDSSRPGGSGGHDLWQVPIIPIVVVDFNGDGIVDCADICIMVDHWHTDEPMCDIAPTPFGDGIVDVQDLIVLAEHLFTYPGAVAYWKLDETEGSIAHDSVGDYHGHGTLIGGPVWQPTGGMIDGALELDGIDDYVSTPFVLNPAEGEFSIFAWIKGGAPGQVVISQTGGGVNWLWADPSEGKLMTELQGTGRGAGALMSQTVITDGNWHRVGLVWDGSYRILYVDDIEVAIDTQVQTGLGRYGGLHLGAGSRLDAGSFFSGLVDDVRIYDRAITP